MMAAPSSSPSSKAETPESVNAFGSDVNDESNLDLLLKENKQLKQRLDQLENENRDLKKAVYDLSVRAAKHCQVTSMGLCFSRACAPKLDDTVHVPDLAPKPKVGIQGMPAWKSNRKADGRQFYHQLDLKGHIGAIYAAQFSKTGSLLASGSFDQSVRIWDLQTQQEVLCFQEHQLNVSDVCWSNDGTVLLSGGFDHCVKEWDVAAGKAVHSYSELQGFIQAVCFNPADNDVFLAGSTSKQIYVLDRRLRSTGGVVMLLSVDAKVSALTMYRNGIALLSGDWQGAMKVWDLRSKACVETVYNEELHEPITSLDMSHAPAVHGDGGVHVAVNSYDNVLRVYDKFSVIEQPQMCMTGPRLVHAIKGTRIKNWPIKSSLFQGHDYPQSMRKRWPIELDGLPANGSPHSWSTETQLLEDANVNSTLLLATGSADGYAYIFDVGGPSGSAEMVQQLEGHSDRVTGAVFHPHEAILATCGADHTVKVWEPKPHVV